MIWFCLVQGVFLFKNRERLILGCLEWNNLHFHILKPVYTGSACRSTFLKIDAMFTVVSICRSYNLVHNRNCKLWNIRRDFHSWNAAHETWYICWEAVSLLSWRRAFVHEIDVHRCLHWQIAIKSQRKSQQNSRLGDKGTQRQTWENLPSNEGSLIQNDEWRQKMAIGDHLLGCSSCWLPKTPDRNCVQLIGPIKMNTEGPEGSRLPPVLSRPIRSLDCCTPSWYGNWHTRSGF